MISRALDWLVAFLTGVVAVSFLALLHAGSSDTWKAGAALAWLIASQVWSATRMWRFARWVARQRDFTEEDHAWAREEYAKQQRKSGA